MERPYLQAWKQYLTEHSTTAKSNTIKKPTTINLYKDPEDQISFDTGVIRHPKELDKLYPIGGRDSYVEFMVATNNNGEIILRWFTKYPDELREYAVTSNRPSGMLGGLQGATGSKYFNKNVCAYLKRQHIPPTYNPNATYGQNTGTPGQPDTTG